MIIFFLRRHKLRRMAELKLLEFLVSVRFYLKTYSRAITFSLLAGLTQYPPQTGENASIYKFDIYLQEYFLYFFQRLQAFAGILLEVEGFTYLDKAHCLEVVRENARFFGESALQSLTQKVEKSAKRVQNTNDMVDIDVLMDILIEQYFDGRKKNLKQLVKHFQQAHDTENGIFSIEDFRKICNEQTKKTSPEPSLSYPKGKSLPR